MIKDTLLAAEPAQSKNNLNNILGIYALVWICLKAEWKELFDQGRHQTGQSLLNCSPGKDILAGLMVW